VIESDLTTEWSRANVALALSRKCLTQKTSSSPTIMHAFFFFLRQVHMIFCFLPWVLVKRKLAIARFFFALSGTPNVRRRLQRVASLRTCANIQQLKFPPAPAPAPSVFHPRCRRTIQSVAWIVVRWIGCTCCIYCEQFVAYRAVKKPKIGGSVFGGSHVLVVFVVNNLLYLNGIFICEFL
jgi:hypothetical protein